MALSIDNEETEKLAAEIAKLTGESEEEAVRQSLQERRDRLGPPPGQGGRRPRTMEEMLHFMETEIWPLIPNRGGPPMTKAERAKLLGYGPDD
ncbi:MAG: Rv0623 family protein transcription factor [Solirubrobacterales bacterium]|nr:Rv0623 family protein transcription factor [Solirubrobacterales bacterium]